MAVTQRPEGGEITTAQLPALITTSKKARATIAPFLPEGVSLDRVAASLSIAIAKDEAAWAATCRKDHTKSGPAPLQRCTP